VEEMEQKNSYKSWTVSDAFWDAVKEILDGANRHDIKLL